MFVEGDLMFVSSHSVSLASALKRVTFDNQAYFKLVAFKPPALCNGIQLSGNLEASISGRQRRPMAR